MLEDDLEGARYSRCLCEEREHQCRVPNAYLCLINDHPIFCRYLWKRAPSILKADQTSELSRLWAVAKHQLTKDASDALTLLLQEPEGGRVGALEPAVGEALVARLRERQCSTILTCFDTITLPVAAAMLQLSNVDCKAGRDCLS